VVLPATKAIPPEVPQAREAGESLDSYAQRATEAANAAAGTIRDLVRLERQWLDSQDGASCPLVDRYGALLNAYSIIADAIWAAHYAPDPALLQSALSNLDDLNASVATAVGAPAGAAEACEIGLDISLGAPFGQVVGTQSADIARDPTRLHESAMGNLIADALRLKYENVAAAFVNSGGLRTDLVVSPASVGEQPGEITWGEMLSVLPFGNGTVILTITGSQLEAALVNGFTPACDPGFVGGTGRVPQLSGLRATFHCDGITPVVDGMWKTPEGVGGPEIPIGPADAIRLVTVDYLYAGGDGYSMLEEATDVHGPGDTLLDVAIDYLAAHSPVAPAIEGRVVGP
jgi:hypothetical protein